MKKKTIREVAAELGMRASTLRYYDREGLLPFVERTGAGYRLFSEKDIATVRILLCLKQTGMPIREIKQYCQLLLQGDASLKARYDIFVERKRSLEAQMEELRKMMHVIDMKCRYYEEAIAAGTEAIHEGKTEYCV